MTSVVSMCATIQLIAAWGSDLCSKFKLITMAAVLPLHVIITN